MNIQRLLFACFCVAVTSCATNAMISTTFHETVQKTGRAELTGWLRLRGEIELYVDKASMQKKERFPLCISGVFSNQADRMKELQKFDKREVTIKGEIVKYADLGEEQGTILPRKLLAGSVVINNCFGDNVLLIDSVESVKR